MISNYKIFLLTAAFIIASIARADGDCQKNTSCLDPNGTASEYLVHDLPNVTFQLPLNWAGQIEVPQIADTEFFFWLFEAENQTNTNDFISECLQA